MKEKDNIALELLKMLGWIFCGWILWLLVFAIFTPGDEEISDLFSQISLILGIITGIIITIILKFNRVNNLKQKVKENFSNIKILDKKGKILLEKANKVSEKYMSHEKEIHLEISKNRTFKNATEFQAIVEKYPNLKANESIIELIRQIKENEDSIAKSKIVYNESVLRYNTLINNFPISMIKKSFKMQDMTYYEENGDIISDEDLGI